MSHTPHIVYGYDEQLPSKGADSEQVMSTTSAMARAGARVELLCVAPASGALSEEQLKRHYCVEGPLRIDQLPPLGLGNRAAIKLLHALRVARDQRTRDAIVHTRHIPLTAAAVAAGRRVLYETYRPWTRQYPVTAPFVRRLLCHRRVVGIVVHSHHTAGAFVEAGIPAEKIAVIHNGWDPKRLEPVLSRSEARRMLGLPERPTVTYTGRVDPEKGLDVVLDIAERCPEVEFVIVGSRGDGPLERRGAHVANVRFVPWQPYDVTVRYLYAADILITPPSIKPLTRAGNTVLPMKLFQYLAVGRVILAPRADDVVELLRHDDNAVLVEPGDVDAAVAAIRDIVADPDRAERIGEAARADAADLTWDARARRILRFLNDRQ